ncbi:uncharacterized protein FA14DRAFT_172090 [Meira miltonrushii]|uniref:BSD domain-containing protein n=1 Tax=Meira miltonrushii TaxID=1280837 RepID=A0A316VGK2_9BASI|nr:uncharacterized protein FA14DRAFT_172090 [Meira miltonrushii]PWN35453.1 hypothetical protein FA14DRAFT_172090 [Meira miltonrushii]
MASEQIASSQGTTNTTSSETNAAEGSISKNSTTDSSTEINQGVKQASIEDDVKQLVGSVSSWWSGFSKKSQEQFDEVRASIDSQGGLVSIAKREAAKFEAQLNEAQKAARQNALASETNAEGSVEGSGKGKGKQVEGDDGADVERLEENAKLAQEGKTRRASNDAVSRAIASSATGDAFFDADAFSDEPGGEMKAIDDAIMATRQNAQSAMQSMQTFWGKIQADPRVNNMQASVAKTLQSISLPKQGKAEDGTENAEDPSQSPQTKRNLALPDLSKQFQAAFPNLDLKESQAMAKRYFEASQSAARDWGKEMGSMMGDLVKVVPPEEGEKKREKSNEAPAKAAAPSKEAQKAPALQASTDDDDFDWDKEVEGGLETTTGPPTTSWEDVGDQVQTVSEAEEQSAKKEISKKPAARSKQEEEEEDSDWE